VLLPTPPAPSTYRPLAGWLQIELDPAIVLAAAPLDRAELVAAGVPPDRFAAGPAPLGAAAVVPSNLGCARAGSAVAVAVPSGGGLSVCAPSVPDQAAGFGPTLASNPGLVFLDPARRALQDGRVDGRLVQVLAAAAMTHDIEVTDFPPVPGEPAGARLRTAVLAGIPPAFDVEGRPAASSLQLYLAAQRPPFHPDLRTTPDGRLIVHFRLPTAGDAAPA
jgi:hypothetical protein